MTLTDGQVYGTGSDSTIGTQLQTHYYLKDALKDLQNEKYFSQLADTTNMPRNFGKTIKRYHYVPMLDHRNVNDQGIDAAGATMVVTNFAVRVPYLTGNLPKYTEANGALTTAAHSTGDYVYDATNDNWRLLIANRAIGANLTTADTAKTHAQIKALIEADTAGVTATVAAAGITLDMQDLLFSTEAEANTCLAIIGGASKAARYGNLYSSSKDIGSVQGKLPALSETGGRVNRVGFTRINLEGTIEKFGFFEEYTEESLNFDTDAELEAHVNREMLFGAHEITEDMLQINLLENAGVEYFPGAATVDTLAELSGNTGSITEVAYSDLVKLDIELTNNRCPKATKIITGSRMVDTKVVPACRIMYIGSEMQPTLLQMTDYHSNPAFIPLAQYAAAGSEINGEIGSVAGFRIVVVPEMLHHAGVGAIETAGNAGYRTTNGRYDAYPMLVIGSESFTTIGFQTSGKMTKFRIFNKKPGEATSDRNDPFGETGFMSIKWYYGFMPLRTERLAVVWSVAQM